MNPADRTIRPPQADEARVPGALDNDQRYPSGHDSGSPTSGYRGDQANPNPQAAENAQDHVPPDLDLNSDRDLALDS